MTLPRNYCGKCKRADWLRYIEDSKRNHIYFCVDCRVWVYVRKSREERWN